MRILAVASFGAALIGISVAVSGALSTALIGAGVAPFIRDDPEALPSDAFGHRDYTDALISILEDESPPPTIGLFGPWGVGKSTILATFKGPPGEERRIRLSRYLALRGRPTSPSILNRGDQAAG
jgi:hypothetical protein